MKHLIVLLSMLTWLSQSSFSQPCNEPPAAEDCMSAPLICDLNILDGYCTSLNTNLTYNGPTPICGNGGVPNNPLWLSFYAGCETLHFTITPSNCTYSQGSIGIQVGIYGYGFPGDCSDSFATPDEYIACSGLCPNEYPIDLIANGLSIGKVYYMIIDGCAGSSCDISISVQENCGLPVIDEWTLDPLTGPDSVCTGSISTYEIASPLGATFYHWYLDSILVGEEWDRFDIEWAAAGTYQLCVDVSNACVPVSADPAPRCITVTVTDLPAVDPDTVHICENDTYTYAGKKYPPGIHEVHLPSVSDCDSIVHLVIKGYPVVDTFVGNFTMCREDTLFLENMALTCNYSGPNQVVYSQADFPFCDSVVAFDILCLYAKAGIQKPASLGNGLDTVVLDGTPSVYDPLIQPIMYSWYAVDSTAWTWWSDSVITSTTIPGTYCLVLTVFTGDSLTYCTDTACVVVDTLTSAIHPTALSGQWEITPVPASQTLRIQCTGSHCPQDGMLDCWDALGRRMDHRPNHHWPDPVQLNVSTWPPGPYWITWTGPDGQRMLIGQAMVQR
ncbi:MAG: hypothetical protein H6568_13250 [Lewinellaceae bacterium]|nr:hypothetical protein [Saprospiraceae bacterium]MCB9313720.1 hypothetical protein [Lewinellaceae bacterium]